MASPPLPHLQALLSRTLFAAWLSFPEFSKFYLVIPFSDIYTFWIPSFLLFFSSNISLSIMGNFLSSSCSSSWAKMNSQSQSVIIRAVLATCLKQVESKKKLWKNQRAQFLISTALEQRKSFINKWKNSVCVQFALHIGIHQSMWQKSLLSKFIISLGEKWNM